MEAKVLDGILKRDWETVENLMEEVDRALATLRVDALDLDKISGQENTSYFEENYQVAKDFTSEIKGMKRQLKECLGKIDG